MPTADDDVLCSVQDLDGSVGVPDRQIPGVQDAPREELSRGLGVFVVASGADVANKSDLSYLFAIPLDVNNGSFWDIRLDDSNGQTSHETMSLSCHLLVFLFRGQLIPLRHVVPLGNRSICLRHSVHMHWVQVQVGHLLKEMWGGWAGRHSDLDRPRKSLGLVGSTQQGVHRWSRVEMGDVLLLQQSPNLRIVDLSQAVMGATDGGHCPGKCPAWKS